MSTYRLDRLLSPRSLAVVGASPHESSVGRHVIANILSGGFPGPIHVVNPHYVEIEGLATVKSMEAITEAPDLVIIAVPATAVPEPLLPVPLFCAAQDASAPRVDEMIPAY